MNAHPDLDESRLVEALKRGEQAAFTEAVSTYTAGMLAVARYYVDPPNAEEIVQDCWVTVIDAIRRFEGRSGLKTWLHRIVANRCKNLLRTSHREITTDFTERLEPELESRFKTSGRWATPPKLRFDESADALLGHWQALFYPALGLVILVLAATVLHQHLQPDQPLREALKVLQQHRNISYFPVVDNDDPQKLVGILNQNDVLAAFRRLGQDA